ncbi:MAG: SDR family NAD(P)-dependent oxidoreductase [Rickettsiales bacterium]
MKILVTGAAGFIGFHTCKALLERGYYVIGVDNLNDYYDPNLKKARLAKLQHKNFQFYELDICDLEGLKKVANGCARIIHLAAQAGVRYSLENPHAYIKSNVEGHLNILELARATEHMVYASSSSVYGMNDKVPFSVADSVDKPANIYAATKRADELMSYAYHNLYKTPMIGLRFFTVYGEWGRPDMAPMKFTKKIFENQAIEIYNHGNMRRDFTYIDDVVAGIIAAVELKGYVGNKLYNIGNNQPVDLLRFIELLEDEIGKKATRQYLPMQQGEVPETYADITESTQDLGFNPATAIEVGVKRLIKWYREYYRV